MSLVLSILPVLFTVIGGYALAATRVLPRERWEAIDLLCFRMLMPAVLIRVIATSDLDLGKVGGMVWALFGTLIVAAVLVFALRRLIDRQTLPDPSFSTMVQTTTRFNGFMALAAAEALSDNSTVALVAIAMAILVPFLNVGNIIVLAAYGTARPNWKGVLMITLKNPLVQSCVIGFAFNLSGVALPAVLDGTLELIGRAAFSVGLLAVGASLGLRRLLLPRPVLLLGLVLRPGLVVCLFLALAHILALGPVEMLAGILVFIVPTAANGYIVARQMGGDSDLYADTMTWQTVLSMVTLPALAMLLPYLG